MAGVALLSTSAFVNIVSRVTAKAGCRCILMCLINVAGQALDLDMLAFERKARYCVIEICVGPVTRIVAVGAVSAEIALMDIILNVTRLALLWRIVTLAVGYVAAFAVGFGVFSQQLEVRQQVVECRFVEPHDVRIATLMVGMA